MYTAVRASRNVLLALAILTVTSSLPSAQMAPQAAPLLREMERGSQAPSPYGDSNRIILSNGIVIDTRSQGTLPSPARSSAGNSAGENRYYLVQLRGPVEQEWRSMLSGLGATVYDYLPNYVFLVGMDQAALPMVSRSVAVRRIEPYQPSDKVNGSLRVSTLPFEVNLLLYPDADLSRAQQIVESLGARVRNVTQNRAVSRFEVETNGVSVDALAGIPQVYWIEPHLTPTLFNDDAQWVVQTGEFQNRRVWEQGIRGENQILSTLDSGINTEHDMFRDDNVAITAPGDYPNHRKVIAYRTSPGADFGDERGLSFHGTHTAGTTCGDDSAVGGTAPYDGMALKARTYFWDIGATSGLTFTDLYGMLRDAAVGNSAGGASAISNSWGYIGADGEYISECREVDQFAWDYPTCLPFFSSGNLGPGDPSIIANPPSTSKDVVSVGALYGWGDELFYWSNRGPLKDGRTSPILTGPGSLRSAAGAGTNTYGEMMGTSMSSPCVASATVLIRQYFAEGWYPSGTKQEQDEFIPSSALLKAMAIASTDNHISSYVAPDNNIGWGRIDLDSALYFAGDQKKLAVIDDTVGLSTGEYVDYEFFISDPTLPLRVALVWTDYPGTPMAGRVLVNDLDLIASDGTTPLQGNVYFDGESMFYPTSRADSVNTEETIYHSNPKVGRWTVRVSARNIPFGPQRYALVVTGGLGSLTGIESPPGIQPMGMTPPMLEVLPNPTSGRTLFRYAIPDRLSADRYPQAATLRIHNLAGQLVKTLATGTEQPGKHQIAWDGNDDRGRATPAGVYFVRLNAGGYSKTERMVVVR